LRSFAFVAKERIDVLSIDSLLDDEEIIFSVVLDGESELRKLLELIDLSLPGKKELYSNNNFCALYDLSGQNMKEMDKDEFDTIYEQWLSRTQRDNSMDEYGQLIFLEQFHQEWNSRPLRYVLEERASCGSAAVG
jgi:hypothetical protein